MKPKPIIYFHPTPGIPVIDDSRLFYGCWHLLNEAFTCFVNAEYYACIACLTASVELWLRRETKAPPRMDFVKIIKKAHRTGIITDKESEELHKLRKTRNSFIHFHLDKLPRVKSMKGPVKVSYDPNSKFDQLAELCQAEVDPYPTAAHKDLVPLSTLAPTSYLILNNILSFFMKRYPTEEFLINQYWRTFLVKFEGLDEDKLVFQLKLLDARARRRPKTDFITSFWKMFTQKRRHEDKDH